MNVRCLQFLFSSALTCFLANTQVHVREWSSVQRVVRILDALPKADFGVVPLDTFLAMAGANPTFVPHFAPAV